MQTTDIPSYLEVLDQHGLSVFIKTLSEGYLAINRSGARLFDRAPAEMIGARDPEVFDASSAQMMNERDENIVRKGQTSFYDSIVQIKGDWTRFRTAKFPVTRHTGEKVILGVSLGFKTKPDAASLRLLNEAATRMRLQTLDFVEALLVSSPVRLPR